MLEVVEGADKDEHHLLVEARDVVPDHEDDGAEFAGDRDGVLRIHFFLLVGLTWGHQVPVDDARLDRAGQLDQHATVSQLWVIELSDRVLRLHNLVHPGDQVLIRLGSNNLKVVDTHELPDHGENVLLLNIDNVLSTYADTFDTKEFHGLLRQCSVVAVVEQVLGCHFRLAPIDTCLVNAVAYTQDNKSIADFLKQVLDEAVRNLHRVDPETNGTLVTSTLNIVIDDASGFELLLSELLQTVLAVENGCDENRVDLLVSFDKISGTDAVLHAHGLRASDHLFCALDIVALLESIKSAVSWVKLVEHIDQLSAVLEVLSKVRYRLLTSSAKVEVQPADKNALSLQLLQIGKLFSLLEQAVDFGALTKGNCLHGKNANELPQDAEHEVGSLIQESLCINANDLDHSLGNSKGLIEVLSDLVDVDV